jgi:hypothetical protein
MLNKVIKFTAPKEYLKQKIYPEPCKLHIPKWYKDLNHSDTLMTIKGCMPFLDTLTTGYVLKIPVDLKLTHNVYAEGKRHSILHSHIPLHYETQINVNRRDIPQKHPPEQLGDKCPFLQKNKNLNIQKILNPWIIKTPPGYSCLFLPPMNNADDRFSIIPGIVDTDTFDSEINFPILVNGDKYPVLETIIEKGIPYVQVIPFLRESWKIKIEEEKVNYSERFFHQFTKIIYNYKSNWWHKKIWK